MLPGFVTAEKEKGTGREIKCFHGIFMRLADGMGHYNWKAGL